ncbi:MAG TPA: SCO family protein [Gammaproteobacteria bacterium]|nr:SCO family protein [Gammaproteobacteria bacterium]
MKPIPLHARRWRHIIPVLTLLWALAGCHPSAPPALSSATFIDPPLEVDAFRLTDHKGRAFTREHLRGAWSLAFFGYSHCPDVCPQALAILNQLIGQLQDQGVPALPRVLFVSLDPEHDSPQQLARYLAAFPPVFTGVTGDPGELHKLTRPLGIFANPAASPSTGSEKTPGAAGLIDHSSVIVLFNPDGAARALFTGPPAAADIARDFLALRAWRGDGS